MLLYNEHIIRKFKIFIIMFNISFTYQHKIIFHVTIKFKVVDNSERNLKQNLKIVLNTTVFKNKRKFSN